MAEAGHEDEILTPHHTTQKTSMNDIKIKCFSKEGPIGIVSLRIFKEAVNTSTDPKQTTTWLQLEGLIRCI